MVSDIPSPKAVLVFADGTTRTLDAAGSDMVRVTCHCCGEWLTFERVEPLAENSATVSDKPLGAGEVKRRVLSRAQILAEDANGGAVVYVQRPGRAVL